MTSVIIINILSLSFVTCVWPDWMMTDSLNSFSPKWDKIIKNRKLTSNISSEFDENSQLTRSSLFPHFSCFIDATLMSGCLCSDEPLFSLLTLQDKPETSKCELNVYILRSNLATENRDLCTSTSLRSTLVSVFILENSLLCAVLGTSGSRLNYVSLSLRKTCSFLLFMSQLRSSDTHRTCSLSNTAWTHHGEQPSQRSQNKSRAVITWICGVIYEQLQVLTSDLCVCLASQHSEIQVHSAG